VLVTFSKRLHTSSWHEFIDSGAISAPRPRPVELETGEDWLQALIRLSKSGGDVPVVEGRTRVEFERDVKLLHGVTPSMLRRRASRVPDLATS
jgi:hypothetical protein